MVEKEVQQDKPKKGFRQRLREIRELWGDAMTERDERWRFFRSVGAQGLTATVWAGLTPFVSEISTNALVDACTLRKFSWKLIGLLGMKEALSSSDSVITQYARRARRGFESAFGQRRALSQTKKASEMPESARAGKNIKQMIESAQQIGQFEAGVLNDMTSLGFCVPAFLISLVQVGLRSPKVLPIVIAGTIINGAASIFAAKKNEKDNDSYRKERNSFKTTQMDVAEHAQRVKDLGLMNSEYGKLRDMSKNVISRLDSLNRRFLKMFGMEVSIWTTLKMVIACITGAAAVKMGKAGVGSFMAIMTAASFAMGTGGGVAEVLKELKEDLDAWKNAKKELSYDRSHDLHYGDKTPDKVQGHFSIKGLSYTYPGLDGLVLKNINLEIGNGLTVITGPSHCGKTTLLRMLTHRREGDGVITLDGIPLTELKEGFLESQMAIVNQQPDYFEERDVSENLNSVRSGVDERAKKAALKSVGLYSEIGAKGMSRKMSELSGGQRQRENLAEAILRDSPILIYDEPTANLDQMVRRKNWHKLVELAKNHTVIVVSHNAQEIESADRVITIQNGRVTQDGTPAELGLQKGYVRDVLRDSRRSLRVSKEHELLKLKSVALLGLKSKKKRDVERRIEKVLGAKLGGELLRAKSIDDVDAEAIKKRISEFKNGGRG